MKVFLLFVIFCCVAFGPGRTMLGLGVFVVVNLIGAALWWGACKLLGQDAFEEGSSISSSPSRSSSSSSAKKKG